MLFLTLAQARNTTSHGEALIKSARDAAKAAAIAADGNTVDEGDVAVFVYTNNSATKVDADALDSGVVVVESANDLQEAVNAARDSCTHAVIIIDGTADNIVAVESEVELDLTKFSRVVIKGMQVSGKIHSAVNLAIRINDAAAIQFKQIYLHHPVQRPGEQNYVDAKDLGPDCCIKYSTAYYDIKVGVCAVLAGGAGGGLAKCGLGYIKAAACTWAPWMGAIGFGACGAYYVFRKCQDFPRHVPCAVMHCPTYM